MEAIISFKFDNFLKADVSEKEITVDATKAIETVNSEINKYLEETNSEIYGDEDLSHTTYYQGSVDIEVQIKYNGEYFSVAEFEDFVKNGFKYPVTKIDIASIYSNDMGLLTILSKYILGYFINFNSRSICSLNTIDGS